MARNITLAFDEEVIRAAKVVAARRGLSLSGLIREQLLAIVEEDERYEAARRSALEWMEHGASLGVGTKPTRDELHNRDAPP